MCRGTGRFYALGIISVAPKGRRLVAGVKARRVSGPITRIKVSRALRSLPRDRRRGLTKMGMVRAAVALGEGLAEGQKSVGRGCSVSPPRARFACEGWNHGALPREGVLRATKKKKKGKQKGGLFFLGNVETGSRPTGCGDGLWVRGVGAGTLR